MNSSIKEIELNEYKIYSLVNYKIERKRNLLPRYGRMYVINIGFMKCTDRVTRMFRMGKNTR